MVFNIKVITNAKQNRVEKIGEDLLKVYTTSKPEKGKANDKVIELLAEYLDIPKSRVVIRVGLKNKNKLVEIK